MNAVLRHLICLVVALIIIFVATEYEFATGDHSHSELFNAVTMIVGLAAVYLVWYLTRPT
jgi:hypothetical protein